MRIGVITLVIVGLVLAVGGAVLWSPGYFWQEGTAPAVTSPPDAAPGSRDRATSSQALTVPAAASVTLPRENVTLTILSGTLEPVNAETRALTLRIRVSNNGARSWYRTYYSTLRLLVDGVPRAPTDSPSEQVESLSAREFDYRFDVPARATDAVLRVVHDDQTGEIQLDLTPRR